MTIHHIDPALQRRLARLLSLAHLASDFDDVDLPLVECWSSLRETYGLAKLLQALEFHCQQAPPAPEQTKTDGIS